MNQKKEIHTKKIDGRGRPRKVDYDKVSALHAKGLSYSVIATQLNITKTTVHRILKKPYIKKSKTK